MVVLTLGFFTTTNTTFPILPREFLFCLNKLQRVSKSTERKITTLRDGDAQCKTVIKHISLVLLALSACKVIALESVTNKNIH